MVLPHTAIARQYDYVISLEVDAKREAESQHYDAWSSRLLDPAVGRRQNLWAAG